MLILNQADIFLLMCLDRDTFHLLIFQSLEKLGDEGSRASESITTKLKIRSGWLLADQVKVKLELSTSFGDVSV